MKLASLISCKRWLTAVSFMVLAPLDIVQAGSTIDPAHPYAFGANVGWINTAGHATNGTVIGQYYCTGYVWSANCGWIALGSGVPSNGHAYANTSASDWGVNHNGEGLLSGYAYGANIGWVTFEQTYGQPRIDLLTGNLSGYAWSANVGWIGLSNAQAYVRTASLSSGPDSDADQLPDAYEYTHTNTLTALSGLAGHDADGDGASDLREAGADTDPFDSTDSLRVVSIELQGLTNRVVWTSRPTRIYSLETTNHLAAATGWTPNGPALLGPASLSTMTQTVSGVTATTLFYRVSAGVPLPE